MPAGIYHERQVAQMCALHALNNLYQSRNAFTKEQLDGYCYQLTPRAWPNPHRSWLGLGNYDVNVIMYAVEQRNCEAIWFDRRRDPNCLDLDAIFGFILNVGATIRIAYIRLTRLVRGRHWLALRRIEGSFYDLDSKLPRPRPIGSDQNFVDFLRGQLMPEKDHELLIIVTKRQAEQQQQQRWLKPEYRLTQESA